MALVSLSIMMTSLVWSICDHVTVVSGQPTFSTRHGGGNDATVLDEILSTVNELKQQQHQQQYHKECPLDVTRRNAINDSTRDVSVSQRWRQEVDDDRDFNDVISGFQQRQKQLEELMMKQNELLEAFNASLHEWYRQRPDHVGHRVGTGVENVREPDLSSRPRDCADVMASGANTSGVYTVFIGRTDNYIHGVPVFCDMDKDGGGWTVFQRRQDGSENFYRTWKQFEQGFGSLRGEFWLGNDNLYSLTRNKQYILRIDLADFHGYRRYAVYGDFKIGTDCENFKLVSVGAYSGDAGDGLTPHVGSMFSTHDKDNDAWGRSCAIEYKGAWWHKACHHSNLNGYYYTPADSVTSSADAVDWSPWTIHKFPLRFSEMKIKPITS